MTSRRSRREESSHRLVRQWTSWARQRGDVSPGLIEIMLSEGDGRAIAESIPIMCGYMSDGGALMCHRLMRQSCAAQGAIEASSTGRMDSRSTRLYEAAESAIRAAGSMLEEIAERDARGHPHPVTLPPINERLVYRGIVPM